MSSSEYWRKRMAAQAGKVYKSCDAFIAELTRQYQIAIGDIEADIAKWYQRFADANGITLAEAGKLLNSDELEEFQWTVEEYIRRGEQNAVSGQWMKELESASARVHISRLDSLKMQLRQHAEELIGRQLKTLPEVLHATYREGYDRTAYELSRSAGIMVSYQRPDFRRIDKVLGTPWSSDGKEFSERIWENRAQLVGSMNQHITQSIIRGEDPQKAINAIAKDMNVSKARAGALVMTESAAIASAAQRDCYKDLDVEEFEYVCTLDEVTCSVCGDMDGQHFPQSKYEIGVTVPPMHPRCRCCTAPYFDDMKDWGAERAARDENGKTVFVPESMTYTEWKAQQDAKFGDGYIDKQRKKAYNETTDKKQFLRYQSVLREEAPSSFEDFQDIKYGDSAKWNELKYNYRTVNRYEIDGDVPIRTVLELDKAAWETKQTGFSFEKLHGKARENVKDLRRNGNAASMLIDGKLYFAHSRASTKGDLAYDYYQGLYPIIGLSEERQFSVKDLGDGIPRQHDTEAKFLEFAAKGRNESDSFEITILSEKHICESCAGVVSQFKKKFPNAKVNIISGKKGYNGDEKGLKTWIHRKKVKR